MNINKIYNEDCVETIKKMPDDFVDLIITSPPYWGARKYGNETLGREPNPKDYVNHIVEIVNNFKRIMKSTASLYLNLGDFYFGNKGFSNLKKGAGRHYANPLEIVEEDGKYLQHKQLLMLPSRIAVKLQDDGWILRNAIVWEKANPMPCVCKDRRIPCYEMFYHLVKSKKYYFDWNKCKEIKSHRDLFRTTKKNFGQHPATFKPEVIIPFILTSSKPNDLVYDPFMGSGTVAVESKRLGRNYIGSEINKNYVELAEQNIKEICDYNELVENVI